jgi:3-oxoacyl-[acyl-carrier-protein] synthase II
MYLFSKSKNIIPKIYNLTNPESVDINYAKENTPQNINYMLKNSFGFGGINVSAVIKRYY